MSAVPSIPEDVAHAPDTHPASGSGHILPNGERSDVAQRNGVPDSSVDGVASSSSKKRFHLHETVVENHRPIKVIVIGAGYSGIYCGIRIPEKIRNCELVIYEKNAGFGGTWYENRYPGCACDVPCMSKLSLLLSYLRLISTSAFVPVFL
jgi:hypothetical protein